jgi:hypothetical protein
MCLSQQSLARLVPELPYGAIHFFRWFYFEVSSPSPDISDLSARRLGVTFWLTGHYFLETVLKTL